MAGDCGGAAPCVTVLLQLAAACVVPRACCVQVLLWSEMQRLCPQHVAPLEGVYEEGGSSYLVQELCRGGSLADHVAAHGPMRESDVRCVMRSLLEFLATCHAHGLLYGDVKASNLMLREPLTKGGGSGAPPDIRVVDFGCSRAMPGKDECLTRGVGTPLYMAPESIARCFGLPSDVWSAGVLMYFLLTGRFPFWEQPLEQLLRNQTLEGVQVRVNRLVRGRGHGWAAADF